MKTMTCRQLGGACDEKFHADTFEEMAEMSKRHGVEMFHKGDRAHMDAMQKMQDLMESPEALHQWYEEKQQEFDQLPFE